MFKNLKLLSQTNTRLSQSHLAQLHIWSSGPASDLPTTPSSPSILLFGFAGSSPHHLAKQAAVYSSLGYNSLAAILPAQHLFSYDIAQVGYQGAEGSFGNCSA